MSAEIQEKYDSRADTLDHIKRVNSLLLDCCLNLAERGRVHDASKLQEPEKSTFDVCTLKLKAMAYGSDEYKAALAELKPALDHHYAANSHHPEHYPRRVTTPLGHTLRAIAKDQKDRAELACLHTDEKHAASELVKAADFIEVTAEQMEAPINGMDLFDVMEMLMDWKAATERMANGGDIRRSLEINRDRFKIAPQLEAVLANTIRRMGW